jgi:hypothetical protein
VLRWALVLGKVIAFLDLVGTLLAGQRWLIKGDVADQVEGIKRLTESVGNLMERVEEDGYPPQAGVSGVFIAKSSKSPSFAATRSMKADTAEGRCLRLA